MSVMDVLSNPGNAQNPFRTTYTPFNALEKIIKETTEKGDFDLDLVKLFIKILKGQGRL